MGSLPVPRFRAYLGASTPWFGIAHWHGHRDYPPVLPLAMGQLCESDAGSQDTSRDRRQAKDQATPVPLLPLRQVVVGQGRPIF